MTANSVPNSGEIIVHVFGKTDVGRTREHNEDSFVVADLNTMNATLQPEVRTHAPGTMGSLFMVADGMGGAAAGEVASAMATEVVLQELDARWRHAAQHDAETFARAIKSAAETANARIHRYASEHPENRGMGTTATIAGLLGDTLYLAQVGDSRAYLVRNGVAQQITKDQSLMQKLVEAGELTAEEAEVSERRNIILQAARTRADGEGGPHAPAGAPRRRAGALQRRPLGPDPHSGYLTGRGRRARSRERLQEAHRSRERERRPRQHHGDRRAVRRRGPQRRLRG